MSIQPDLRAHLANVARQLDATPHRERGAVLDPICAFYGWSQSKLYRRLKSDVGWSSGRKARADKGTTSVPEASLLLLGAAERESLRANDKQILFTPDGAQILEQNGVSLPVSNSQLNRLMRARKLNVEAQRRADPVQSMKAEHPNHTHQVDPSLCVLYYMKDGRQAMMDADKFYKNKFENYFKVKLKVWRYVLWDAASSLIACRYYEAAGENSETLFQFLTWCWGKQEGREFHGVPRNMVWDKGSANTAAAIKNLLAALEVTPIEHAAGKARVKGGVEGSNNLIECKFECRLKLEPVHSCEELNAAALAWQNAFNADLIARQDNRLKRPGLAVPTPRLDLWRLITAEQLRVLPAVEVLRPLLEGREEMRRVSPKLSISYRHPAAQRAAVYPVHGLDGICAGDEIAVRPLLYGDCAIHLRVARYDGSDLFYRVEPERNYDRFGQPESAATWGESHRSLPHTAIEHQAKRMDELAYPGEDATKQRQKQATPFGGTLDAHSHLAEIALPLGLPRRGSEITVPDRIAIEARPLNLIELATALAARDPNWSGEKYAQLARLYPEGALEADLPQVEGRINAAPRLVATG